MNPRLVLVAAALSLAACGTKEKKPEEVGPLGPAQASPGQELEGGRFATHWDMLVSRYPAESANASFEQPAYATRRLRIELLRAVNPLLPPAVPQAEILVAMEGRGTIEIAGKPTQILGGEVAILPAGARGTITGIPTDPLVLLAIRDNAEVPVKDGKPVHLTFDKLWAHPDLRAQFKRGSEKMPTPLLQAVVGSIPGALSLQAVAVRGDGQYAIVPQKRAKRDLVMIVLQGMGSFGMGFEGSAVRGGSIVGVPSGVDHYYANAGPDASHLLIIHAPELDDANDVVPVK